MIALIQRVSDAAITVDGVRIASVGRGMVALIGIEKGDNSATAVRMAERLISYRIFADSNDRMNLSLADIDGELLLVPNFTLAADTRKGSRASFTPAASPESGKMLFDELLGQLNQLMPPVQSGLFGADMKLSLVNDGPVTFIIQLS